MKKPTDSRTRTDELPSFLDDAVALPATAGTTTTDAALAADPGAVATVEPPDDGRTGADDPASPDAEEHAPAAAHAEQSGTADQTAPRRLAPTRRAPLQAPHGGGAMIAAGCALVLGAIGLAFAPAGWAFADVVTRLGATPGNVLVLGAVLAGTGAVRRRIAALQGSMHDTSSQRFATAEALQEGIQFLVAAQQSISERPPAAGEELQQVLLTLQRQDDKVNNLTKAIKMYGKPLMEISGQGAELAAALAQVRTAVDTANEATRQAVARLEVQLRNGGSAKQELADVQETLRKLAAAVEAASGKQVELPSLEPIQQQLVRIDVGVQAMSQRLEDNEVRRSLLRLEDTTQKSRDEMQQLLRGESVERATAQLQKHLDSATTKLFEGLSQMRDGNLGGIESAVRDIQREVTGVATAVAQIQATVKAGAGRAAPQPAAQGAPAPTAPTASTAPAAPTPPPAPQAAAAPAAAPTNDATSGAAAYQTGTRSTNSKNVLGAIAKLKKMKT